MTQAEWLENGIDYDEGLNRFSGFQAMYEKWLRRFLDDPTMGQLREAMNGTDTQAAFAAAHTLKGVSGNLSLKRLYDAVCALTEALRGSGDGVGGDMAAARPLMAKVEQEYEAVSAFLKGYFA